MSAVAAPGVRSVARLPLPLADRMQLARRKVLVILPCAARPEDLHVGRCRRPEAEVQVPVVHREIAALAGQHLLLNVPVAARQHPRSDRAPVALRPFQRILIQWLPGGASLRNSVGGSLRFMIRMSRCRHNAKRPVLPRLRRHAAFAGLEKCRRRRAYGADAASSMGNGACAAGSILKKLQDFRRIFGNRTGPAPQMSVSTVISGGHRNRKGTPTAPMPRFT